MGLGRQEPSSQTATLHKQAAEPVSRTMLYVHIHLLCCCVGRDRQTGGKPAVSGSSSAGKAGSVSAADLNPELPYNKFKPGEGVLISHQVAQQVWLNTQTADKNIKRT